MSEQIDRGAQSATSDVADRLRRVYEAIRLAADTASTGVHDVTLVAVSKQQPGSRLDEAIAAGQLDFGENYLAEAIPKITQYQSSLKKPPASTDSPSVRWHFIGRIQSNKTKGIAEHFDWVHSIDRLKLVDRLARHRPATLAPLHCCVELNINAEATKGGVSEAELRPLLDAIRREPRLSLRGIMCLPAPDLEPGELARTFDRARTIFDRFATEYELDTLSMGTSRDYALAIEHGSNLVRVGTDIFGPRPQNPPPT